MRNSHTKSYNNSYHDDHLDHFSHKKKRNCNDSKQRDNRCDQKLVKDCVCVEWDVPYGETQTVFKVDGSDQIYASGFISFDGGGSDFVTVKFFLGKHLVGEKIKVFEDSSVVFNYAKFDRITIECPRFDGSPDPDYPDSCEGEICIITRYFV